MPVNNFEKQVQQKMDELQLRPSAEVWEEVEKRIRKEKRRRRFIIWFFLFGVLVLGSAAWWAADNAKKQTPGSNSVVQATADKNNNELTTGGNGDIKKQSTAEEKIKNKEESDTENQSTQQPVNSPVIIETEVKPNNKKTTGVQIRTQNKKEKIIINTSPVLIQKKSDDKIQPGLPEVVKNDAPVIVQKINKADSIIITDKVINTDSKLIENNPVVTDKNAEVNKPADIMQPIAAELKDSLITKQDEPLAKKDTNKTKKNKWEFGVTAMAGSSGRSDGISIFDSQKSFDALSFNNGTGGSVTQTTTTVAAAKRSFSGQLGFYAKRKLTGRTGLSAGLNFSVYSIVQPTGIFVDSTRQFSNNRTTSDVSAFYRNGTSVSYKSHYNFLQIPVSFHWQINKGIKLPLVWQNGFSTGILTGSNALIYNSGSNVFYRDNQLLHKIQFIYQSGLYIKLFNKSKNPLTAGVVYNYHFSKLEKVNLSGSNHLSSFGVQLGWLLPLSPKGRLDSKSQYNK